MKKAFYIIATAITLGGCADITSVEELLDMSFGIGTEQRADTKTFLTTGNNVLFSPNDSIAVVPEGKPQHIALFRVGSHTEAQTVFNDVIYGRTYKADRYYALYPWSSSCSFNNSNRCFITTLPSEQYKPSMRKTFDPKAALSVGMSDLDNYFHMMNVGAVVKVTFTDRIFIDKLVLSSLPGTGTPGPLAGNISVQVPLNEMEEKGWTPINGTPSSSVTLYIGNDGVTAGDEYCFVVLPGYHPNGLKLEAFIGDEPKFTLIHNNHFTIKRSKSYSFPAIDPGYSDIDFVELEELDTEYYEW